MEERTIKVDLTTAKQWFKAGGFKKELALKAFDEDELREHSWRDIKSFRDVIRALNLGPSKFDTKLPRQARAVLLLGFVREALNGRDWNPSLNEGRIYYSWCRWYLKGDDIPKEYSKVADFKDLHTGKVYTLVGGGGYSGCYGGLGDFEYGYGDTFAHRGLLGCKSPEIAKHLSKYFGKLIFDAIYGQYNNYEWV